MSKFPFSVANLIVCDIGNTDGAGKLNLIGMRSSEVYLDSAPASFDEQTLFVVIAPHSQEFSFAVEYFGPEGQGLLRGDFNIRIAGDILPHYRCHLKMPVPPMKFLGFGEYYIEVRCEAGVVAKERFMIGDAKSSPVKPELKVQGRVGINTEFFLQNGNEQETAMPPHNF